MNRKIFMLLMALALAVTGALLAQSTGTTTGSAVGTGNQNVDSSGQPEQTGRPDVDVDTGRNADNGVLDVDVDRNGDADTRAQGDGTAAGTTRTTGTIDNTTTGGAYDNSAD